MTDAKILIGSDEGGKFPACAHMCQARRTARVALTHLRQNQFTQGAWSVKYIEYNESCRSRQHLLFAEMMSADLIEIAQAECIRLAVSNCVCWTLVAYER